MNSETNGPVDCRICQMILTGAEEIVPGAWVFDCPRCGRYEPVYVGLPLELRSVLGPPERPNMHRRSRLSHILRRQQRGGTSHVALRLNELDAWRLDDPLPTPAQQLDALVSWCGEHQLTYSDEIALPISAAAAWIGAPIARPDGNTLIWLLSRQPVELMEVSYPSGGIRVQLTLAGWSRLEELQRAAQGSRNAFMAMKFGDPELDFAFQSCFRPAASRAGFDLTTLISKQPAGNIDDQMRVRLRTSRFVLADLTHGNPGAYWEAGFAEGLGRPVIYTCRKREWDLQKTHFDTNHLVTIIWDSGDLPRAGESLTATIRATLPSEAILEDQ